MRREILISASAEESWVALREDGRLAELMFDRAGQDRVAGDIFLGVVEAVLPGLQAAFVDIGREKAAFLHASDLARDDDEGGGDGVQRDRSAPPVQEVLSRGQEILVKVTKEAIAAKGPRVTAQISLPGRFLVYIPDSSQVGVSRKIEHQGERARLRAMAREVVDGGEGGVIVRTAGKELTKEKLEHEYRRLHRSWKAIEQRARKAEAPTLVHSEAKLISGVIRDLFTSRFESVTSDNRDVHSQISQYVRAFAPELIDRVHYFGGPGHLFDDSGIADEIQRSFQPRVDLPSGGYIVIEQTEALVAIDVNSGRSARRGRDPDRIILKTNLDAAREIATQLRLRDIGGIVVIDFIDMEDAEDRQRVLHELRSHLGRDRARTRTSQVSDLGLMEMTRQRVRPSIMHSLTEECAVCEGSGRLWTAETIVREIERSIRRAGVAGEELRLLVCVHPRTALHILEKESRVLDDLARAVGVELHLRDDPLMRPDQFRLLSGRAEADVTGRYRVAEGALAR
ncbi:MAG: Rne/Rng family ribonuclease [Gemmatimonadetes bacterium]|nr:Rne/Rng family ribonuclease [Gemmatimonadota bacterium]